MQDNQDISVIKAQFDAYYETTIIPSLSALEAKRKKYLLLFSLISPLALGWLVYAFSELGTKKTDTSFCYLELVACLLILVVFLPMLRYYRQSKESILPLLAGFFGKFTYMYKGALPYDKMEKSSIFKFFDKIEPDDSFSGIYNNVAVSINEYKSYRRYYEKKGGFQREMYKRKGQGIIFLAEMNKSFTGKTIVVTDKGVLNKLTHYKNMQRVGVESPEFEKAFEVYATDQIEARYILTTVMLEYMTALKRKFPKIEFSFFDAGLFINIPSPQNHFECNSFFTSILNKKRIYESFTELLLLFSIVDTLRLNQKKY